MKAIQIEAFGKPVEVLKVVNIPDVGAPGANEIVTPISCCPTSRNCRADPGSSRMAPIPASGGQQSRLRKRLD